MIGLLNKRPIPKDLPQEIRDVVEKLRRCKTKEECLKKAYDIITQRFYGERIKTYLRLPEAFISDPSKLWKKKGFLHCTNQNYLLRILLVKSSHFKDEDIEQKLTHIFGSPHQYLRIKVGKKHVNVDPWSHHYGVKFGRYQHGFVWRKALTS